MAAVRPYRAGDAEALAALTLAAIRETGARAYSPAQVAAWAARFSAARVLEWADRGDTILVAAAPDDALLAFSVFEAGGHVEMLYCHPAHTGKGLALALLAEVEAAARAQGVRRLFTEASELARPVFARAGYELIVRRDFTIAHEGRDVAIHNYAMAKQIA